MTEFLTENARRAYPLDRGWPEALRERWTGTLVDACVYTSAELGPEERISLLSVRRAGLSLVFRVGIAGRAGLDITVASGHDGFTTSYAASPDLKAILTFDGRKVSAIARDSDYPEDTTAVDIPFAARCVGGAPRMVTSITAQGAAVCSKPRYSLDDPNKVEATLGAGEHAFLVAGDGIDLEVLRPASLAGDVLRVSAIASTEPADMEEEPIDIMIRGDECFSVDAEPGVRASGSGIVTTGVVRIGNTCKPCCQCEDYKDAVDLLRPAERGASEIKEELDGIKAAYGRALAAFEAAKTATLARINSTANVRVTATAATSTGIYTGSDAVGTRQRVTVTTLVENMTLTNAEVSGVNVSVSGFTHCSTAGETAGTLPPGGTLMSVATYYKDGVNSNAVAVMPIIRVTCTIDVGSQSETRSVVVS